MSDQYQGEPVKLPEEEQVPTKWAEAKEFTPASFSLESFVDTVADFVPTQPAAAFQTPAPLSAPYHKPPKSSPKLKNKLKESKFSASATDFVPSTLPFELPIAPTAKDDYPSLVTVPSPSVLENKVWGTKQGYDKIKAPPIVPKQKTIKLTATTKPTITIKEKPEAETDPPKPQLEPEFVPPAENLAAADVEVIKGEAVPQVQGLSEQKEEEKHNELEETKKSIPDSVDTIDSEAEAGDEKPAEKPSDKPTEEFTELKGEPTEQVSAVEEHEYESKEEEITEGEQVKEDKVPEREKMSEVAKPQSDEGKREASPVLKVMEEESKEVKILQPFVYTKEMILAAKQRPESHERTDKIDMLSNRTLIVYRMKPQPKGPKPKKGQEQWEEVPFDTIRRAEIPQEQMMLKEKAKQHTERRLAEVAEDVKLKRKVKITLNKLAPTNFDKLKVELCEIIKNGRDLVKELAQLIFDKAWSETRYTSMYANLCSFINNEYGIFEFGETSNESRRNKNGFRKNILTMCQDIFETELELKPAEDLEDQHAKLKKKILGNVRFIGELYKVKILKSNILLECIKQLLLEREGSINEDKLEGAIILLRTCGTTLELKTLIKSANEAFDTLESFKERVSLRLKFLIMNLQDLRMNSWVEVNEGPKTVGDVREEHRREQERTRGYPLDSS
mmetsp:Transcript_12208/g.23152  ORF Transcript_12208/g.23152 Transcript_12208/m.23152 type:complete len:674 (+) Transcript_12208:2529-4550(+)